MKFVDYSVFKCIAFIALTCSARTCEVKVKRKSDLNGFVGNRCFFFFFKSGADPSALNDKKQAALHLAVELNRVAVLQVMCKFSDRIDTCQGGRHGRTALHLAAIHDNDECARILVSHYIFLIFFKKLICYKQWKLALTKLFKNENFCVTYIWIVQQRFVCFIARTLVRCQ